MCLYLAMRFWLMPRIEAPAGSTDPTRNEEDFRLKHNDQKGFADRRKDAEEARKKLLKKFEKAPGADDPRMKAKAAERQATAERREKRQAERERAKAEAAEQAKLDEAARIETEQADAAAEAERLQAEAADAKAERDRRYAARKSRRR